jgi:hypothetical protein
MLGVMVVLEMRVRLDSRVDSKRGSSSFERSGQSASPSPLTFDRHLPLGKDIIV